MGVGEYLLGLAFALATLGSALAVAGLVLRSRLAHLTGAPAGLAFAVVACTALLAAHLVPGLIGVLSRESALLSAVVLVVVVRLWLGAPGPAVSRLHLSAPDLGDAVAWTGVALAAGFSVAAAWAATAAPSADVDTLTFHLPNMAKWIQTGSVWHIHQFTPLVASGNYPHNGDLLLLGAVMPFDSDAWVRAAELPFLAVLAVAVYALACEAGARRATAALAGALVVSLPVVQLATFEGAKTDAPMLATAAAGLYFLARHLREPRASNLVLAGLGLGIAFGTKWYALWVVPILIAMWVLTAKRSGVPWRALGRWAGAVAGLVVLAGGVWLVRNAVESGSPLYPSAVRPAGITLFDAPRDYVRECAGYSVLSYVDNPRVIWHLIFPAWRSGYAGPGLVLVVGWLAALVLWLRNRSAAVPAVVRLSVLSAPLMAVAYAAAPYSAIGALYAPFAEANLRWLVPAAVPAAVATAWVLTRLPRTRRLAEALILIVVFDSLRRSLPLPVQNVVAPALGFAGVLAVGTGVVVLWRRGGVRARVAGLALAVALVIAVAGAGYLREERYARDRYASSDPVTRALARHGGGKRRVALAGVWGGGVLSPVLPAFGPRLRDHVDFVGPTVRGQLREYATRQAFQSAIRRGRYGLLVVGRGGYGAGCVLPGEETDDDAWAVQAGYRLLARTPNLSLYSVPGGPR